MPVLTQQQRAKAISAAKEVLVTKNISIRAAAEKHEVNCPSLVQFYVQEWKGTEMILQLRLTQNDRVDAYIAELTAQSIWPPSKKWPNVA